MVVRQQKVPTIIIDETDETVLVEYLTKNIPLFKGHIVLFYQPVSKTVKALMTTTKTLFIDQVDHDFTIKKTPSRPMTPTPKQEVLTITKMVRSGEIIESIGDVIITQKVNDGALVKTEGSLILFGIIEGDIICNGNYLITRPSKRGKIRFQGVDIQDRLVYDGFQIVKIENDLLVVKEIS